MISTCRPRETLVRDQTGVIFSIPALVMGSVLVGACFYMIAAWRDVNSREGTQIAADAVAATGAAWLAAGMNVLALINVLMAVALAAFVAYRAAELVAVTVAVIAGAFAFTGVGAAIAAQASNVATKLFENEKKIAEPLMRGLNIATTSERAVALAFPYLSVGASGLAAYTFDHDLDGNDHTGFGLSVNLSLAPTALDMAAKTNLKSISGALEFPERMGRVGEGGGQMLSKLQSKLPNKLKGLTNVAQAAGSLPVEDEDYAQLCSRAAERWSSLLTHFGPIQPFAGFVDKVAKTLGGNMPVVLCQPVADTLEKIADQAKEAAENEAEQTLDKWAEERATNSKECRGLSGDPDGQRTCIARVKEEKKSSKEGKKLKKRERRAVEKRQKELLTKAQEKQQASTDTIKTAKVWSFISGDTIEGDDTNLFMNVWSYYEDFEKTPVESRLPEFRALVNPFLHGQKVTQRGTFKGYELNQSSAKARMSFACPSGANVLLGLGSSDRSCAENALWIPGNWTWQYGVDRSPGDEALSTGKQAVSGYVGFLVGKGAQKLIGTVAEKTLGKLASSKSTTAVLERLRANHTGAGSGGRWGNITAPDWIVGNAAGDVVGDQLDKELPTVSHIR